MSQDHKKYPRVLILSHNPLSDTQNNGKTLSAFFKNWETENIAQLYLTTDLPDFSLCCRFFQIHDVDILKRLLLDRRVQGRRVTRSDLPEMANFKGKVKTSSILKVLRNNGTSLLQFSRDLAWKVAGYKTREMRRFIDEFDPEVVFFQSSKGVCAFSLAKWICRTRNIPLVLNTTDDYVSGRFTLDPFFWIQHVQLVRAYQWAVSYSDCVVAISEQMAAEYRQRFGGNYLVAQNSIDNPNLSKYLPGAGTVKLVYAGNLGLNRWKILGRIAGCLQELRAEEGFQVELSIYSLVAPAADALSVLNAPPVSSYKGALNSEELKAVISYSDALVHVEAFDKKNRHITRLSISTKIPEYLVSGRCIFAVGPEDVASMQYLVENDLGVIVTSVDKARIKQALRELITNSGKRTRYAEKGLEHAELKHSAATTAASVFEIISTAVRERPAQAR